MYALFKETSHANFISHKSNYGTNPVANPKNWVAFDGQHVHYSTNNLKELTQELVWYFRKTAGDDNESIFNDRATITAIKGNSVAWNQLLENGNFTSLSGWDLTTNAQYGLSVSNNVLTFNAQNASTGIQSYAAFTHRIGRTAIVGHIYYISFDAKFDSDYSETIDCALGSVAGGGSLTWINNPYKKNYWQHYSGLAKLTSHDGNSETLHIRAYPISGKSSRTIQLRNVNIIDLTLVYNGTTSINDCLNFEADYFKWFGHPIDYEPYDLGSIRNTKINALKTVGFNQWDEQWEVGGYTWDSGLKYDNTDRFRNKEKIYVLPNQNYYFSALSIFYYNSLNQYITESRYSSAGIYKTPNNCCYVNIINHSNPPYINDICINISDNKLNGTYEAYEDRTYSIPITSITGKLNGTGNSVVIFPEGMKSAGNIRDEIINEGGVTKAIKRLGVINLRNYTFFRQSNNSTNYFYSIYHNQFNAKSDGYCICSNYITGSWGEGCDGCIGLGGSCLNITDLNYADATQFNNYIHNNDIYCVYPLNTPQTYIIDNFNLPINTKVWKSGTERYEFNDSTGTSPKLTIHYNAQ